MIVEEAPPPKTKNYIPWELLLSAEEYKYLERQKGLTNKRRLVGTKNFSWHIGPSGPMATEKEEVLWKEDFSKGAGSYPIMQLDETFQTRRNAYGIEELINPYHMDWYHTTILEKLRARRVRGFRGPYMSEVRMFDEA